MEYWMIAAVLLILALGLAVLEVFFPSGGLLAFLCAVSVVGAVLAGFRESVTAGIVTIVAAGFGLPVIVVLGLHFLPKTAVGRRILLEAPSSKDVLPSDERQRSLKELVGRTGKAKSRMLPAGVVKIDGRTIDAVSEGVAVEPGQVVRVLEVRGNRVVVRPVDEANRSQPADPDDPLSRPIDTVAQDPFDEGDSPSA